MLYLWWAIPLFLVVLILGTVICILPALLLKLVGLRKASDALTYGVSHFLANFILWLVGIKVQMTGDIESIRERDRKGEGFCFVSNHTSMLDVILVMGKMKVKMGFVAKSQLVFVPFVNLFIAMTH